MQNLWDEAAVKLGYDRNWIKRQFYLGVYDRIRTAEQEKIVVTVLRLQSPLSYKAEKNNKNRRGNNGIIRSTSFKETKQLS
jgi:hypothetical protein